jgi:TPP-dependent pyruvate/acetoin dehydrogenase alpha subunit
MGQGIVYESMNVASLWSLPVLFVLEDNGIAQTTPKALEHAGDLASRSESFAVNTRAVLADDVFKVYAFASAAVAYVRHKQMPFFLVLKTDRLGPHSKGDDTRPPEEIAAYYQRDPLRKLASYLTDEERRAIEETVESRIHEAVESVKDAFVPSLEEFQERWPAF